jgi:hypothetical protein
LVFTANANLDWTCLESGPERSGSISRNGNSELTEESGLRRWGWCWWSTISASNL